MSAISQVLAVFCNATTASSAAVPYGLHFNCTGSHCGLFNSFKPVNCKYKGDVLVCSNNVPCQSAPGVFTSKFTIDPGKSSIFDIDAEYHFSPDDGFHQKLTVTLPTSPVTTHKSTPVTKHHSTTPITTKPSKITTVASTGHCAMSAKYTNAWQGTIGIRSHQNQQRSKINYAQLSEKAYQLFEKSYRTPNAPAQGIANALADLAYNAAAGNYQGTLTDLINKYTDTIMGAVLNNNVVILKEVVYCQYEDAIKDAVSDVGQVLVNDLAAALAPETFGGSLIFMAVSHALVGAIVGEMFDIGDTLMGHKRSTDCSTTTTTTSPITTPPTSKPSKAPTTAKTCIDPAATKVNILGDPSFETSCAESNQNIARDNFDAWWLYLGDDISSTASFETDLPNTGKRALRLSTDYLLGEFAPPPNSSVDGVGGIAVNSFTKYASKLCSPQTWTMSMAWRMVSGSPKVVNGFSEYCGIGIYINSWPRGFFTLPEDGSPPRNSYATTTTSGTWPTWAPGYENIELVMECPGLSEQDRISHGPVIYEIDDVAMYVGN